MGVPSFFRWLQRKYPTIIVDAIEERCRDENGKVLPADCTEPNLNHQEFDNLYLDMNGIIHPCTHPEHRPPPKTEEEMFELIFEYIDRLFAIIRPRRLLYMAIDGVAPRAKMNQQRSRRFRAAKEAVELEETIQTIRDKLEGEGIPLPPKRKPEERFDSNCITPGTPFMDRLAIALRYYIHNKITLDPAWEKIEVILSDANAPGEGEHKIMDFIRRQRSSPSHDPNTAHCLCGADADLIMLGLATHENNFTIIREEFIPNQPRPCVLCHMYGHELENCRGLASDEKKPDGLFHGEPSFIFIRLAVLREYLEREMKNCEYPFEFDLERAIDDWVFMCFFVGNDFLPHLPSLEIREGAIDRLIKLYKDNIWTTDGWLTDAGEVNMRRVEVMMESLGVMEDEIFRRRKAREERYETHGGGGGGRNVPRKKGQFMPQKFAVVNPLTKPQDGAMSSDNAKCSEMSLKLKMLLNLHPEVVEESGKTQLVAPWHAFKAPLDTVSSDTGSEKVDDVTLSGSDSEEAEKFGDVKLHEPGFKERYYPMKFGAGCDTEEFRHQVARDYVEGLCWVLKYYYQGCASWDWYYPHHYAPFASDFKGISSFKPDFSKPTKPFNPLEQLMAVFPAGSRDHIPKAWHSLMTDPHSPLISFYPKDFEIDLNGKKFAWQGVALLPFVDQTILLGELHKVYSQLTDEEKARNVRGTDRLFISQAHKLFENVIGVHMEKTEEGNNIVEKDANGSIIHEWFEIDPSATDGLAGYVAFDKDAVAPGHQFLSFSKNHEIFPDVTPNTCLMMAFRDPQFVDGHMFPATRLEGIVELEKTLKSYNHNGQYQPNTGFSRNRQYAKLDDAGHRMVNHFVNKAPYSSGGAERAPHQYNNSRGHSEFNGRGRGRGGGRGSHEQRTNHFDHSQNSSQNRLNNSDNRRGAPTNRGSQMTRGSQKEDGVSILDKLFSSVAGPPGQNVTPHNAGHSGGIHPQNRQHSGPRGPSKPHFKNQQPHQHQPPHQ